VAESAWPGVAPSILTQVDGTGLNNGLRFGVDTVLIPLAGVLLSKPPSVPIITLGDLNAVLTNFVDVQLLLIRTYRYPSKACW